MTAEHSLLRVSETAPYGPGTGWGVLIYNEANDPMTSYVWAICGNVG